MEKERVGSGWMFLRLRACVIVYVGACALKVGVFEGERARERGWEMAVKARKVNFLM